MPKQTIYFDEAGNTGAALSDIAQPTFVLASTNMTNEEADAALSVLRTPQTTEVKFALLRKSEAGQRRVLNLLSSEVLNSQRIKTMVIHKRFMVVTKLVDLIEETLMHNSGIDLYERGGNLALSNLRYCVSPVFCSEDWFNEFLESFVQLVRNITPDTKRRFSAAVHSLYFSCTNEEYKSSLAPYMLAVQNLDSILDGVNYLTLDPAIPSFFRLCNAWGDHLSDRFDIIHDRSKPMAAERTTFEAMMDESISPMIIGYDRRMFEFPLRATGIKFADSVSHSALQLSDVIAGATSHFCASHARGKLDEFAQSLKAAGIDRFIFDAMWPTNDVTPEALGTSAVGGINAVEHMTKSLH